MLSMFVYSLIVLFRLLGILITDLATQRSYDFIVLRVVHSESGAV